MGAFLSVLRSYVNDRATMDPDGSGRQHGGGGMAAMMKLLILATAVLLAGSEVSLAAQKSRSVSQGSKVSRDATSASSDAALLPAYDGRQGTSRNPFGPGRNLPYSDHAYGDPGRW
jgi:hypothetical protein